VGREGMPEPDRSMLDFADAFEREVIHQGVIRRSVAESLDMGCALMQRFSLESRP